MNRWRWLGVLCVLALACGDDDGGTDAGSDADMSDAPTDAPDDAPVDAPMIDAPMVDAPMTDAPMTDAPMTDAPVTDAGPDAFDAGTDAPVDPCDPNPCFMDGSCSIDSEGMAMCPACPTGFMGDGMTCVDIDGCDGDPCFTGVTCTDVPAPGVGFMCGDCTVGLEGDGVTCTDINGCATDPCFTGVTCTDVAAPGTGFMCGACPSGLEGDGVTCTDIDGCATDPCFAGVTCTDVPAPDTGFTCGDCPAGSTGDGETCTRFEGLVINEVDYDQDGADDGEFVELLASVGAVDLSGLTLYLVNGSTSTDYDEYDLSALGMLASGGRVVLGDSAVVAALPGSVAAITLTGSIQNGGSAPDGLVIVRVATGEIVDALSYEGSITNATIDGTAGFDLVEGTAATAEDPSNRDASMIRRPDGTDTDDADSDWAVTTLVTPGTENAFCVDPSPTAGPRALVFSAIDTDGDVVVVTNTTGSDVPIGDWWWCERPAYVTIPAGTTVPANGSVTFFLTTSGVNTATEIYLNDARFDLDPAGDEIALYNTNTFGSSTAIEAFAAFGAAPSSPTRQSVAVAASLWTTGDFIPLTGGQTAMVATGTVTTSAGWTDVAGACVP